MNSAIYTGYVTHARLEPVKHVFRYSVCFCALDIDELEILDRSVRGFGYNRLRPMALHDRDYLDASPLSIKEKIRRLLGEHRVARLARIVLVTSPRHFNYVFNPASFYYCLDARNELFCCVVEVHNTFREHHVYMLDDLEHGPDGKRRAHAVKAFHVSPFNDMQGGYDFTFSSVGDAIDIDINLVRDNRTVLVARLHGEARPLTSANLARVLLRVPLIGWLTMPRILLEASLLYFRKKLPVFTKPNPSSMATIRVAPPRFIQGFAMKRVLKVFEHLGRGRLHMGMPDGSERSFGDTNAPDCVGMRVRNYRFFWRVLRGGDLGFAESYMAGDWDCEDLAQVFRLFIDNPEVMEGKGLLRSLPGQTASRLRHLARRNSLSGSRRNIEEHYDLSNEFFSTFLDQTMTYSSGLFTHPSDTLEAAQRSKLQTVVRKARIAQSDHVLEIGSGWGSFAIEAAATTGCRVTTLTLSEKQKSLAEERIRKSGLQDRIDVQLRDYREVQGQFDRIVSIEMLEAVGSEYYGEFFATLERLLKPDGLVVLQVIAIPDQRYRDYCRRVDFIQAYIFPGGVLPSLTALCEAMTGHSKLVVEHLENFNQHYARTLRLWRERFVQETETVSSLGFGPEFRRKWEYYLAYCEAGFSERILNLLQVVLTRPGNRRLPPL